MKTIKNALPRPRHVEAAALLEKLAAATAAGIDGPRVTFQRAAEIRRARPSDVLAVDTMVVDGARVPNPRDLRMVVEQRAKALGVSLALEPEALLSSDAMQRNLAALEGAGAVGAERDRKLFADHRMVLLAQAERGEQSGAQYASVRATAAWALQNQHDPAQVAAALAGIHAEVNAVDPARGAECIAHFEGLFVPNEATVAAAVRARAASPAFWQRAVNTDDVRDRLQALVQMNAAVGDVDIDGSRRAGADHLLDMGEVALAARVLAGDGKMPALALNTARAAGGVAQRLRDTAKPLPDVDRFIQGLLRAGVATPDVRAALSARCEAIVVRHVATAGAASLDELQALAAGIAAQEKAPAALTHALAEGAAAAVAAAQGRHLAPDSVARAACAVVLAESALPLAQRMIADPAARLALAQSVDAHLARCGDALLLAMTDEDARPQAPAFGGGTLLGYYLGHVPGTRAAETAPIAGAARAALLGAVHQALEQNAGRNRPHAHERTRLTELAGILNEIKEGASSMRVPHFGATDVRFAHHDVRAVMREHLDVVGPEVEEALRVFLNALRPNPHEAALLNVAQLGRALNEAADSVARAHRGDAETAGNLRNAMRDVLMAALRAGIGPALDV